MPYWAPKGLDASQVTYCGGKYHFFVHPDNPLYPMFEVINDQIVMVWDKKDNHYSSCRGPTFRIRSLSKPKLFSKWVPASLLHHTNKAIYQYGDVLGYEKKPFVEVIHIYNDGMAKIKFDKKKTGAIFVSTIDLDFKWNYTFKCKCDINEIMSRGCFCGGI